MSRSFRNISILMVLCLLTEFVPGLLHARTGDNELSRLNLLIEESPYTPEQKVFLKESSGRALQQRIPARDVSALIEHGISRNVDAASLIAFLTLGIELAAQSLPAEPVLNKIDEGLIKNKSSEEIQQAAFAVKQRIRDAGAIIDEALRQGLKQQDPAERRHALAAMIAALRMGLAQRELSSAGSFAVEQKVPLPLFTRTIESASFLAALGMPADLALRTARQFIYQKYSAAEMGRKEAELMYMRSKGVNWVDAFYCMLQGQFSCDDMLTSP